MVGHEGLGTIGAEGGNLESDASYIGTYTLETAWYVRKWCSESPKQVSGRNLAEYSAETVSVKIVGFGDERNIR